MKRFVGALFVVTAGVGAVMPFSMRSGAGGAGCPAPPRAPRKPRSIATLRRPIPAYAWTVSKTLPTGPGATATLIDLTSQRWLTEKEVEQPLWKHWLVVVTPEKVTSDIGFLFIGGGRNDRNPPAAPAPWLVDAARDTGTVVAELRMVPNQPLVFTDDRRASRASRTTSSPTPGTSSCAPATSAGRRACR